MLSSRGGAFLRIMLTLLGALVTFASCTINVGGKGDDEEDVCEEGDESCDDDLDDNSSDETPECNNSCFSANDGHCDDGGPGSEYELCDLGTDCNDCGSRDDDDNDSSDDDDDDDDDNGSSGTEELAITVGGGTTPTYDWPASFGVADLAVMRADDLNVVVWGINADGDVGIEPPVTHGTTPEGADSYAGSPEEELELEPGVEYVVEIITVKTGEYVSANFTP